MHLKAGYKVLVKQQNENLLKHNVFPSARGFSMTWKLYKSAFLWCTFSFVILAGALQVSLLSNKYSDS